ncbi:RnfH family protein [Hydrogenophaga sp. YM1]|uniref:RnfH family protein n=1 Tax=Hydrogenophaga sp. YM1 TaxID=2806262 RepID=UPI00195A3265|nr:RnfH family protein [Hydrogenophaga sp. YM1]QRR32363.1 RnfH family protein [Hydrogenophaga sp. YM1]
MRVTLLYASAPRMVHQAEVDLPDGASARDALRAAGWLMQFPETALLGDGLSLAVWGRRCEPDQVLREGDRLELLRALRVDPKVARRERFAGQGARGAGLFSKRRPNSKAGY